MAITQAQIVAAVLQEIPKIMQDGFEKELQGRPDFIANGTPESIVGKYAQAGARAACRAYAANPDGLTGDRAVNAETACRPYLDDIGQGSSPSVATPFSGGQCPGIGYDVNLTSVGNPGGGLGTSQRSGVGPVGGVIFSDNGFGNFGIGVQFASGPEFSGGGQANTQAPFRASWRITSIVRQDGQADNCGDPPPAVTQPIPEPDPIGNPFRFNPDPSIDVPITVTIGPDGQVNFDFGGGPTETDPFAPSGGGDGGGGGAPSVPGTAGDPQDTGSGDAGTGVGGDAEGEAPPGQVLTGVKIDILTAPSSRVRYTTEIDRGVVYVYMGATEGLALEPTGSLVRSGQFFPSQKDYFTRWQVRARFGYDIRATPYYRSQDGATT